MLYIKYFKSNCLLLLLQSLVPNKNWKIYQSFIRQNGGYQIKKLLSVDRVWFTVDVASLQYFHINVFFFKKAWIHLSLRWPLLPVVIRDLLHLLLVLTNILLTFETIDLVVKFVLPSSIVLIALRNYFYSWVRFFLQFTKDI